MPKQQKYAVGTTVSKVFIDPNTQQPRIYSEDIGVRELSKIVDERGSGKVRADDGDDLATQQDSSSELLLDDDLDGRSSEEEYYEHATQQKRRRGVDIRKGRSSSSGNAVTLEAIGVTTNHQHQDGSPMQQPSSGRKKRKQHVKKTKESQFEQRIVELRVYKEKHGHVNVKQSEDKSLYKFCKNIRYGRNTPEKSTTLVNKERIASLDALGFDWTVREYAAMKSFEQRIADLQAYKTRHGHVDVKERDDQSLYGFCIDMRYARNNPEKSDRALTDDRVASLDDLGFKWSNSGIKSFSQQTDRPPSKKRKQRAQGKVDAATKKKHVSPKWSAKNDKGSAASSDQMEASVTAKDAAALLNPLPTIGYSYSSNAVSAVIPLEVSTTNAILDTIDLTTDVETESVNKHSKSFASILLEKKGMRLVQVKQEMVETQEDLKDVREDLDIANDTVTQQAVFTNAWQNKFEELAKLAEAGRVDGSKILEIRNRSISISTGRNEAGNLY